MSRYPLSSFWSVWGYIPRFCSELLLYETTVDCAAYLLNRYSTHRTACTDVVCSTLCCCGLLATGDYGTDQRLGRLLGTVVQHGSLSSIPCGRMKLASEALLTFKPVNRPTKYKEVQEQQALPGTNLPVHRTAFLSRGGSSLVLMYQVPGRCSSSTDCSNMKKY